MHLVGLVWVYAGCFPSFCPPGSIDFGARRKVGKGNLHLDIAVWHYPLFEDYLVAKLISQA